MRSSSFCREWPLAPAWGKVFVFLEAVFLLALLGLQAGCKSTQGMESRTEGVEDIKSGDKSIDTGDWVVHCKNGDSWVMAPDDFERKVKDHSICVRPGKSPSNPNNLRSQNLACTKKGEFFYPTNLDTGTIYDVKIAYLEWCNRSIKSVQNGLICRFTNSVYVNVFSLDSGKLVLSDLDEDECAGVIARSANGFICSDDERTPIRISDRKTFGHRMRKRDYCLRAIGGVTHGRICTELNRDFFPTDIATGTRHGRSMELDDCTSAVSQAKKDRICVADRRSRFYVLDSTKGAERTKLFEEMRDCNKSL